EPSTEAEKLTFSAADSRRMEAFAREQRIAVNTLFQTAWALLLGTYSGRKDVVFGTVVSGRPPDLTGADQMVGLFIISLPVRIAYTGEEKI
ncbi:condensation domain-containing protein, partial [Pseudoneobacillus sp. C159]